MADSNKTEKDKSEFSTGLIAGYHHVFYSYLIGVEAFADLHYESATNDDGGIGLKVGKVMGDSLVFARLGVTGSKPSWRPEYALGVEYKLTKKWSLTGNIAYDRSTDSGIRRSNTSLTAGLNYYLFGNSPAAIEARFAVRAIAAGT